MTDGKAARASANNVREGYTRRRSPRLVVGGSCGLDGTHGVGAGQRRQSRTVADPMRSAIVSFAQAGPIARTRRGLQRDTPDEETTDWRAVCGKTARTVRRAGRATPFPTPITPFCLADSTATSLRAKRSNPEGGLDCFVAALLAMTEWVRSRG